MFRTAYQKTLMMPGLLESRAKLAKNQAPALAAWLRKATERVVAEDYYELLLQQFGYPAGDYQLAQLRAIADGLDPQRHWLCADPLHLAVDVAHIYSLGNAYLELSMEEVSAVVEDINKLLDNSVRLVAVHPLRWYLELTEEWHFSCVSPQQLLGKTLVDKMPEGRDALPVKSLFNEIQMLLYGHEVNQQRRQQQRPTLDGVWFWGAGKPLAPLTTCDWDGVISDDPIVCELARLNNICLYSEADKPRGKILLVDVQYQFQDVADVHYAKFEFNRLANVKRLFIGNGLAYDYRSWWGRLCRR